MIKKIHIKHIADCIVPLCGTGKSNTKYVDTVRGDLGYDRYKGLLKERFRNEGGFRWCKRCLAVIKKRERR